VNTAITVNTTKGQWTIATDLQDFHTFIPQHTVTLIFKIESLGTSFTLSENTKRNSVRQLIDEE
jgi:hypothetical protein